MKLHRYSSEERKFLRAAVKSHERNWKGWPRIARDFNRKFGTSLSASKLRAQYYQLGKRERNKPAPERPARSTNMRDYGWYRIASENLIKRARRAGGLLAENQRLKRELKAERMLNTRARRLAALFGKSRTTRARRRRHGQAPHGLGPERPAELPQGVHALRPFQYSNRSTIKPFSSWRRTVSCSGSKSFRLRPSLTRQVSRKKRRVSRKFRTQPT